MAAGSISQGRSPDTDLDHSQWGAPSSPQTGPLLSERPPGFWFPLRDLWGYHCTSPGFSRLLCEMKELDWLLPSSETLGFCLPRG